MKKHFQPYKLTPHRFCLLVLNSTSTARTAAAPRHPDPELGATTLQVPFSSPSNESARSKGRPTRTGPPQQCHSHVGVTGPSQESDTHWPFSSTASDVESGGATPYICMPSRIAISHARSPQFESYRRRRSSFISILEAL